MVRPVITHISQPFEERNIIDEQNMTELLDKGGKPMVPFLVDEEKNVSLYESGDIIAYLEKEYGGGPPHDESGHGPSGVCPI